MAKARGTEFYREIGRKGGESRSSKKAEQKVSVRVQRKKQSK